VKFLYNNQCDNLTSYTNCTVVADKKARLAALGSLFHLIQDSYSGSHTSRGVFEQNEQVHAKINCLPIKQFSTYKGQNEKAHSNADKGNVSFSSTCTDSNDVHDPILSGAIALWYLSNEDASFDHAGLIEYLQKHVFATPYSDFSDAPRACAGNFDPYTGKCDKPL
jgi:hypothetical protein